MGINVPAGAFGPDSAGLALETGSSVLKGIVTGQKQGQDEAYKRSQEDHASAIKDLGELVSLYGDQAVHLPAFQDTLKKAFHLAQAPTVTEEGETPVTSPVTVPGEQRGGGEREPATQQDVTTYQPTSRQVPMPLGGRPGITLGSLNIPGLPPSLNNVPAKDAHLYGINVGTMLFPDLAKPKTRAEIEGGALDAYLKGDTSNPKITAYGQSLANSAEAPKSPEQAALQWAQDPKNAAAVQAYAAGDKTQLPPWIQAAINVHDDMAGTKTAWAQIDQQVATRGMQSLNPTQLEYYRNHMLDNMTWDKLATDVSTGRIDLKTLTPEYQQWYLTTKTQPAGGKDLQALKTELHKSEALVAQYNSELDDRLTEAIAHGMKDNPLLYPPYSNALARYQAEAGRRNYLENQTLEQQGTQSNYGQPGQQVNPNAPVLPNMKQTSIDTLPDAAVHGPKNGRYTYIQLGPHNWIKSDGKNWISAPERTE